ncbi:hypothetical protein [Vulcanisaeta distributa]|nr:hypothetical protein [Vulcanisaeta distributa]
MSSARITGFVQLSQQAIDRIEELRMRSNGDITMKLSPSFVSFFTDYNRGDTVKVVHTEGSQDSFVALKMASSLLSGSVTTITCNVNVNGYKWVSEFLPKLIGSGYLVIELPLLPMPSDLGKEFNEHVIAVVESLRIARDELHKNLDKGSALTSIKTPY